MSNAMTFEEFKALLDNADRYECKDHAFGDMEISWCIGDDVVAGAYFGKSGGDVWPHGSEASFTGDEAEALRRCGTLKVETRNDTTGPDEYHEGTIMPGLTLEGVREELTGW